MVHDDVVLDSLRRCFDCKPVAIVVNKNVFCVHGGLSPRLSELEQISRIERPAALEIGSLLHDLLTSKPDSKIQGWSNINGNITFGPDIVCKFLKKFNLDLICQGREIVETGFEFLADRQLVMIFSAPSFDFKGEPTLYKHDKKGQDSDENSKTVGAVMAIDDNFMCTFRFMKIGDQKFNFEVEQPPDRSYDRGANRTLKTIQELPKVKATEILPIDKIGRKKKFEAAVVIEELEYHSAV